MQCLFLYELEKVEIKNRSKPPMQEMGLPHQSPIWGRLLQLPQDVQHWDLHAKCVGVFRGKVSVGRSQRVEEAPGCVTLPSVLPGCWQRKPRVSQPRSCSWPGRSSSRNKARPQSSMDVVLWGGL